MLNPYVYHDQKRNLEHFVLERTRVEIPRRTTFASPVVPANPTSTGSKTGVSMPTPAELTSYTSRCYCIPSISFNPTLPRCFAMSRLTSVTTPKKYIQVQRRVLTYVRTRSIVFLSPTVRYVTNRIISDGNINRLTLYPNGSGGN